MLIFDRKLFDKLSCATKTFSEISSFLNQPKNIFSRNLVNHIAQEKHLMVKMVSQTVKFTFPEHIPVSSFTQRDLKDFFVDVYFIVTFGVGSFTQDDEHVQRQHS